MWSYTGYHYFSEFAFSQRKPKLCEESAISDSETDASVEFHDTDDDDDGTERSNKLSLEFDTDITELNKSPAFTYELRQRKPGKYRKEIECELDELNDNIEGN